jgi:hypothetical protein
MTNLIDTRDLHDRYNELQEKIENAEMEWVERGEEDSPKPEAADVLDTEELSDWEELSDMEDGISDFWYGETLIPDDEFTEYAEELADDLGLTPRDAGWPVTHIDWEAAADALRQDYTEYEWQGTTYLAR